MQAMQRSAPCPLSPEAGAVPVVLVHLLPHALAVPPAAA